MVRRTDGWIATICHKLTDHCPKRGLRVSYFMINGEGRGRRGEGRLRRRTAKGWYEELRVKGAVDRGEEGGKEERL